MITFPQNSTKLRNKGGFVYRVHWLLLILKNIIQLFVQFFVQFSHFYMSQFYNIVPVTL